MITQLELGITDGVSMSLVSINVRKLAGDSLNITGNFLYCNHQVYRDFSITLYIYIHTAVTPYPLIQYPRYMESPIYRDPKKVGKLKK
jgi:hypothetical protein